MVLSQFSRIVRPSRAIAVEPWRQHDSTISPLAKITKISDYAICVQATLDLEISEGTRCWHKHLSKLRIFSLVEMPFGGSLTAGHSLHR
jgi:hypothetical protein